jgi:hypothetical protein
MMALDDTLGAVDGAAIDDQNFLYFYRLSAQCGETSVDPGGLVQYRQEYCDTLLGTNRGNLDAQFGFR